MFKDANICLCKCIERMQRFACLYDMETGCVCVLEKPLNTGNIQRQLFVPFHTRKFAVIVGLRHACTNASVTE